MTTTDTDALEERIARELFYTESPEERHRDGWLSAYSEDRYLYRDLAAAVLPIVAVEVRKAKAEAWDEGYMEATSGDDNPLANPYRYEQETGHDDER